MIPTARRALGEDDKNTLRIRLHYARALCMADGATLDDVREALNALEHMAPTSRRVLGSAHPTTVDIERTLPYVRARARETPSSGGA